MHCKIVQYLALPTLVGILLIFSAAANAATETEGPRAGHTTITGVVTEKAGVLMVTTPKGATHQLNSTMSRRHGHQPFKAGDEVIAVLDENNYVVDMHLKGEEGKHQLVTGKLIHVGRTKKEIKLQTSNGEEVFLLTEQAQKTKGIAEGTLVTVELNEAGAVIDLHPTDIGSGKHERQSERELR
jgi:hypothetical protein